MTKVSKNMKKVKNSQIQNDEMEIPSERLKFVAYYLSKNFYTVRILKYDHINYLYFRRSKYGNFCTLPPEICKICNEESLEKNFDQNNIQSY